MSTYIVIPAFNEEKSIAAVIEGLLHEKFKNIIVVDDGSSDKTRSLVKNYPVFLINHLINLGQGAALQTGTEFALKQGAKIIVHFDADGQHRASDIQRFIEKIEQGYEIVLGSRFLSADRSVPFTKKYFLLKPGILINWFFTGLKLTDAHNGFRALSANAANLIRITQNGMAHNSEICEQVSRKELNYAEVPVDIIYKEYGQGFGSGVKIVFDLIKQRIFR
jgi:glycosyltransferase involved in cell wall biosynthesis